MGLDDISEQGWRFFKERAGRKRESVEIREGVVWSFYRWTEGRIVDDEDYGLQLYEAGIERFATRVPDGEILVTIDSAHPGPVVEIALFQEGTAQPLRYVALHDWCGHFHEYGASGGDAKDHHLSWPYAITHSIEGYLSEQGIDPGTSINLDRRARDMFRRCVRALKTLPAVYPFKEKNETLVEMYRRFDV